MISYTPFRYPGGKAKLYKKFNKLINENNLKDCTYIEPFCGGSGLAMKLLFKGDIKRVIINDLDPAINFVKPLKILKFPLKKENFKKKYILKKILKIFYLWPLQLYI